VTVSFTGVLAVTLKKRDQLEDLVVDGMILLKLEKIGRFGMGTDGRLL